MSTDLDSSEVDAAAGMSENTMQLTVNIVDKGSCRKHVSVTVSAQDVRVIRDEAIVEIGRKAQIPGFRSGKAPASLLRKKFREEIEGEVKQKVLIASLEQISAEYKIEPIGEPRLNVNDLIVPEDGDFSYEFDVEVRPTFDLPDFSSFTITRSVGEPTADDVAFIVDEFLEAQALAMESEEPAAQGDLVVCRMTFTHAGKVIRTLESEPVRVRSTLNFPDGRIEGFQDALIGARVGDSREFTLSISLESEVVEMRGESVHLLLEVAQIRKYETPELNNELVQSAGFDSLEDFQTGMAEVVQRQITYRQREETRKQLLEQISATADWDLPESLVRQQTENATRREMLEMTQAGFTTDQVLARHSQIQQNAIQNTRAALKQHFILDRIATENNIEVSESEISEELVHIARQKNESVRRVRARMVKNGMIENLEAQLRERKAIDFLLSKVQFNDIPREPFARNDQSFVRHAICGNLQSSLVDDQAASEDSM